MKTVHVLQPVRGIDQLNESVTSISARDECKAHELDTINPFAPRHELVDVAMIHPSGYHRKAVLFQVHAEQW